MGSNKVLQNPFKLVRRPDKYVDAGQQLSCCVAIPQCDGFQLCGEQESIHSEPSKVTIVMFVVF